MRGMRGSLIFGCFVLASAAAFADQKKPDPTDEQIGEREHRSLLRMGLKLSDDPVLQERVERVGRNLERVIATTPVEPSYGGLPLVPMSFRFFVVKDDSINAFSLPGGYIYMNTGILRYMRSDDELAGVLGHEMMHSYHRHGIFLSREADRIGERATTASIVGALVGVILKMEVQGVLALYQIPGLFAINHINSRSRRGEYDADHGAVPLTLAAGYNPVGVLTMLERLAKEQATRPEIDYGIYRTHPLETDRVKAVHQSLKTLQIPILRRPVTGELAVKAVAREDGCTSVEVSRRELFCSQDDQAAREFASRLDRVLDRERAIWQAESKGTILAFADATVQIDLRNEQAAGHAARVLKSALWRALVENEALPGVD